MKVLHIIASLDKSEGGPSRSVPLTCEQLAMLGVEIELIARPSKNPIKINTSKYLKFHFKSIFELIFFCLKLSKKSTDLIHLQHIWAPYIHVMALIARIKRIPYIITPRGMLEPWIMNHNRWKKNLGMLIYQRNDINHAALIHATCEMEKNNIRKLGFKNPITVIPNGIDVSNVPNKVKYYGSKKMIFLSRIHEKKGIELLLDAWKQLECQDWKLEIAGEGDSQYLEKLKNKIVSEEITHVQFVGPKYGQAKQEFLQSADLFVLPSYSENFGMVVVEALISGIPVITTTGTPWQELVINKCGWWIELNSNNLKVAMQQAIGTSLFELQEMGNRGKELILTNYTITQVGSKIKKVYEQIIEERCRPNDKTLNSQ